MVIRMAKESTACIQAMALNVCAAAGIRVDYAGERDFATRRTGGQVSGAGASRGFEPLP